jgi:hypothetical protein
LLVKVISIQSRVSDLLSNDTVHAKRVSQDLAFAFDGLDETIHPQPRTDLKMSALISDAYNRVSPEGRLNEARPGGRLAAKYRRSSVISESKNPLGGQPPFLSQINRTCRRAAMTPAAISMEAQEPTVLISLILVGGAS